MFFEAVTQIRINVSDIDRLIVMLRIQITRHVISN